MATKTIFHRCSFCGGNVIQLQEDIILKFPQYTTVIEGVLIGKCEDCGEYYHPAETSLQIEKKIEELVKTKRVSEKDRTELEILYSSNIIFGDELISKSLIKRLEALETAVGL